MAFPSICTPLQKSDQLPIMVDINCLRKVDLPHSHNYVHVCYVLAGSMTFSLGERTETLGPGSCVIVLPYVNHCLNTFSSEDTPITVMLSFQDSFLTDYGYEFFSHAKELARFEGNKLPDFHKFTSEEKQQTDFLMRQIIAEFSNHFDMSFEQLAKHLADFLHILCTEPCVVDTKKAELIQEHAIAISSSIKYMALHYGEKISTSDLCRIAAMSQCAYTRKFKALTGMSPITFLTRVRASEARMLLITTNMSMSEIAKKVGFYDKSRFIHAFKTVFGTSPMELKKSFPQSIFDIHAATKSQWEWVDR